VTYSARSGEVLVGVFHFLIRSSSTTSLPLFSLFSRSSKKSSMHQRTSSTFSATLSHFVPHEQPRLAVWLTRWEHCCPSLSTWRCPLRHTIPLCPSRTTKTRCLVVSVGALLPLPFDLTIFISSLYAAPHWSSYRLCQVTV